MGSTITRIGSIADPESNLLNGLYSISGLSLNGKAVTSSTSIVEKQMVFRTTATWLLDDNEPKVILSPSRLRIPNSSYKLLGYIPDISGHGNNGVINNSAYAEGSGVNEDGSYQFDSVDDFVTIPTLSNGGKQMLMKVNWHGVDDEVLYDQRNSNIQGNYDLTNYNHAYDKMSGYGGYSFSPFSNTNDWQLLSSDNTMELLSIDGYSFTARRLEGSTWWKYRNKVTTNVSKNLTIKIRTNKSVRINWELKYRTSEMPNDDNTLGLVSTLLSPNVITDVVLPVKTKEELNTLGAISHFYIIFFLLLMYQLEKNIQLKCFLYIPMVYFMML